MGENSKIEWTDHTFNPWYGCTKVSPACDHCYAESWAKRSGLLDDWGKDRRRSSPSTWRKPVIWNHNAKVRGVRARVFCASLADWLDNQVPDSWRGDLAKVIEETPHLDWLLLTKRPQNWAKHSPWHDDDIPSNVWIGATVENEEEAVRRLPHLIKIPARIRFVSYEPALGPVDWSPWIEHLHWIIAGGESGPNARPSDPRWFHETLFQCQLAKVPFLFKQWGEWWHPGFVQPGVKDFYWPLKDGSGPISYRVGKNKAGRKLNGREYNEFPRANKSDSRTSPGVIRS